MILQSVLEKKDENIKTAIKPEALKDVFSSSADGVFSNALLKKPNCRPNSMSAMVDKSKG